MLVLVFVFVADAMSIDVVVGWMELVDILSNGNVCSTGNSNELVVEMDDDREDLESLDTTCEC